MGSELGETLCYELRKAFSCDEMETLLDKIEEVKEIFKNKNNQDIH